MDNTMPATVLMECGHDLYTDTDNSVIHKVIWVDTIIVVHL